MTTARREEPLRFIFISLSVIMAAVLVYFALTAIPGSLRPTVSPSTVSVGSSTSAQP